MAPRHAAHGRPGPGGTDCDIAILGAGLAGLSLAARLAAPRFADLRILVLEARTDYCRDPSSLTWRQVACPAQAAHVRRWSA